MLHLHQNAACAKRTKGEGIRHSSGSDSQGANMKKPSVRDGTDGRSGR